MMTLVLPQNADLPKEPGLYAVLESNREYQARVEVFYVNQTLCYAFLNQPRFWPMDEWAFTHWSKLS